MRYCFLFLATALSCTGCTTLALERQALSQAASPTDIRYQEVMDNLAMIAADPFALPTYTSIFAGTAQVTDTAQFASSTTLGGPKVGAEALTPQMSRLVTQNWSLDPINAPEKLEAIRCACRWVVFGPEFACKDCIGLLDSPYQFPCPGRHFGVKDRMCQLPTGWLHTDCRSLPPKGASYKARSGDVWVWVMPEDMKALADFNLILQDIARVDINSPTIQYIRPVPSDFLFPTLDRKADSNCPLTCNFRGCACPRDPAVPVSVVAEVSVDPCLWLMPDIPYYKWRTENYGTDPNLRTLINASGLH